MRTIIYVACPYSHPDDKIQAYRAGIATRYAANLLLRGHYAYSPLTHNRPLALSTKLPHNWEFWRDYDFTFLILCKELHVLCIEGWERSLGVKEEIEFAKKNGIIIKYVEVVYK